MIKKVLILDDEEALAEAVYSFLASNGYEGHYCTTAAKARDLYNLHQHDLIISDINMPEQNGITFFKSIKDELKQKNTGFILMTGNVDAITMQNAYDLGVSEFVLKPFDLEDLKIVVDLVLRQSHPNTNEKIIFYSVPLQEFIQASSNNYDVYLNMDNNFMLIAKKGQELSHARLSNYLKKGLNYIYLTSQDYAKYIDMACAFSNHFLEKPTEQLKKIKMHDHLMKAIKTSGFSSHLDFEIFKKSLVSFENYSQVAFKNEDIFKLLQTMAGPPIDKTITATHVAVISIAIATYWKWTHPKVLSKITLAALLCQIGLQDYPNLLTKKRHEFLEMDLENFDSYPQKSYSILAALQTLPEEVLKVALQHRENELGQGKPQGLSKDKQHPYSRLIHGVIEFFNYIDDIHIHSDLKKAMEQFYSFQQKTISEQVLKSLFIIFNMDVPKDLASVLLPFDTGRMS